MKKIILFITFIFSASALAGQTKTYKGAWFDIKYPSSFTVKPSLKSSTSDKGYESAFFESPDRLVEFYVFSPQWSGNATDIDVKNSEKITATKTETTGHFIIKWWTIAAKNGSYTRSYQEKTDTQANTNWVIGIKYKNQGAFSKYKKQYLSFKASLVQYAD
jgi:hypothetical protein